MAVECARRTEELKTIIDEATKYLVANDIIKGSDILASGNNDSFTALGFIAELSKWSFNVIDDTYTFMNEQERTCENANNRTKDIYSKLDYLELRIEEMNRKLDVLLQIKEEDETKKK